MICALVSIFRHLACVQASQEALVVRNPPASATDLRDAGSIPGSGRLSGEGNRNPLQYSRLGSPTDRGAWWVGYSPLGCLRV